MLARGARNKNKKTNKNLIYLKCIIVYVLCIC